MSSFSFAAEADVTHCRMHAKTRGKPGLLRASCTMAPLLFEDALCL